MWQLYICPFQATFGGRLEGKVEITKGLMSGKEVVSDREAPTHLLVVYQYGFLGGTVCRPPLCMLLV